MEYHGVTQKIKELLTKSGVWFETFEHAPVRTSEEAARVRPEYSLKQGAKTIIVRVKEGGGKKYFAMLVMPGDVRFETEKVKKLLSAKDIRFATEEEVGQITGGVEVGGVPPFGNLFKIKVLADPSLFKNEKIVFNAGDRSFSIAMKSEDYRDLVKPDVEVIV